MSENIYSTPASNLNPNKNFKGKPAKAIFIGLLISMLGSVIGAVIIGIAFGIYWGAVGLNPEEIESLAQTDTLILIAFSIEGGIFSIWSGHYVARKTNYQEYRHGIIMILIGTLIGVALIAVIPGVLSAQPLWYTVVGFVSYPITVVYGCWLYVKSKA